MKRSRKEKTPFPRVMSSQAARMALQSDLQDKEAYYTWDRNKEDPLRKHQKSNKESSLPLTLICVTKD